MKKLSLFIILVSFGLLTSAQEKNGTVFIQHPAIEKTQKLWDSFVKGDKAAYGSMLADTVGIDINGNRTRKTRAEEVKSMDWWINEFENLKWTIDTPAYADAIEYQKGGLWVQDWLRMKGTHKKTGINLDVPVHSLYSFNKEGQITSIHRYFNNDVFDEIRENQITKENGKVFIGHPYIITVRKLVNAFCAGDIGVIKTFYAPNVKFSNSTMKWRETHNLEEQAKEWEMIFAENDNIKMKQIGYPDCIYYEKNDDYVVYSWWNFFATNKKTGKKVEMPMMLSHTFDKDGKIVFSLGYYSSNHYEND